MGQQQLLLLVLGIVIVGLAVVVGIQAFGENQKKANADALVNDAIRIASDAQAWRLKPAAFGGGGGNQDSAPWDDSGNGGSKITFEQLGYAVDGNDNYVNLNGTFTMAISGTTLTITGTNTQNDNKVTVEVTGTAPENIKTTVSSGS